MMLDIKIIKAFVNNSDDITRVKKTRGKAADHL